MTGGPRGVWVRYAYCISILVLTFRRYSEPVFVRDGESRVLAGLPYTLLTLVAGWWGFPFGLIFTPLCLFENLSGGKVVGTGPPGSPTPQPAAVRCPGCYSTNVRVAEGRRHCATCGLTS